MNSPRNASVTAALEAAVHRVLARLDAELADLGLTHGEINALAPVPPMILALPARLRNDGVRMRTYA
jgi:hypothetical protein